MKNKVLRYIFKKYNDEFYDFVIETFIGEIPDTVREPALDFLADRRVLFEKFLSIQAYHIQKARVYSKKSQEFYDGALMIVKAFLVAVNRKVTQRTTFETSQPDAESEVKKELAKVTDFFKAATAKPEEKISTP